MVGIYKIINPKGRVYIGQSIDVYARIKSYKNINVSKRQARLHASLNKYGYDSHEFICIEKCEVKFLNERERYYQDLFDVIGKNGMNCTLTKTSDKSGKICKETLKKLSKIRKGKKNSLGRVLSSETKKKMSDSAKIRGVHKNFMEASIKANTGSKHSKERIMIRSEKQKKINSGQEAEIKLLLSNGVYQMDIAKKYNVSQRVISKISQGIY